MGKTRADKLKIKTDRLNSLKKKYKKVKEENLMLIDKLNISEEKAVKFQKVVNDEFKYFREKMNKWGKDIDKKFNINKNIFNHHWALMSMNINLSQKLFIEAYLDNRMNILPSLEYYIVGKEDVNDDGSIDLKPEYIDQFNEYLAIMQSKIEVETIDLNKEVIKEKISKIDMRKGIVSKKKSKKVSKLSKVKKTAKELANIKEMKVDATKKIL